MTRVYFDEHCALSCRHLRLRLPLIKQFTTVKNPSNNYNNYICKLISIAEMYMGRSSISPSVRPSLPASPCFIPFPIHMCIDVLQLSCTFASSIFTCQLLSIYLAPLPNVQAAEASVDGTAWEIVSERLGQDPYTVTVSGEEASTPHSAFNGTTQFQRLRGLTI